MNKWYMNSFERWMLKRIAKRLCRQSNMHRINITDYYEIMYRACQKEFREDSPSNLYTFLLSCFKESTV